MFKDQEVKQVTNKGWQDGEKTWNRGFIGSYSAAESLMPEGQESWAGCEGKKASGRKEAGEASWCVGTRNLTKFFVDTGRALSWCHYFVVPCHC